MLLPKADRADAESVALKLVEAVRMSAGARVAGLHRRVTVSVGVAMFEDRDRSTGSSVIVHADRAMYDAKRAGRDRFAFFATSGRASSRTSL
jgi:diguanylate cyclase (GGDEF)-like protein